MVQWLRLQAPNTGGSVPSLVWELDAATESLHASTKSSHSTAKDSTCHS